MIRDYVALDLEMTGLSPRKDAILEIGAVTVSYTHLTLPTTPYV